MSAVFFIVLILDQVTKYLARNYLRGTDGISIIGDFFRLSYVENRGAAFGILQHQKLFFIVTTVIIIAAIFYIRKKYRNRISRAGEFSLQLILAGAVGNLIDRVVFSFVTDFLDFKFGNLYDFPVFNIADIAVVVGTAIIIFLVVTDKDTENSDEKEKADGES